jgi:hypothetical protein
MAGEEKDNWKTLLTLLLAFILVTMSGTVQGNASTPLDVRMTHRGGGGEFENELEVEKTIFPLNPYEWEELARYIFRYKSRHDGGIWNICGQSLSLQEMKEAALEYSKEILIAHHTTFYTIRRGGARHTVKVPYKGVLGTMMSESRLDYCAIGPNPRKWAKKKGLLPKPPEGQRGTPSYTREQVLSVLHHPTWRKRLADLGLGQIVWGRSKKAIYKGDPEDLLSLRPGIKKVFEEMADRGQRKNSRRPWEYWPGERRHTWYDIRVTRFERAIFSPPLKGWK